MTRVSRLRRRRSRRRDSPAGDFVSAPAGTHHVPTGASPAPKRLPARSTRSRKRWRAEEVDPSADEASSSESSSGDESAPKRARRARAKMSPAARMERFLVKLDSAYGSAVRCLHKRSVECVLCHRQLALGDDYGVSNVKLHFNRKHAGYKPDPVPQRTTYVPPTPPKAEPAPAQPPSTADLTGTAVAAVAAVDDFYGASLLPDPCFDSVTRELDEQSVLDFLPCPRGPSLEAPHELDFIFNLLDDGCNFPGCAPEPLTQQPMSTPATTTQPWSTSIATLVPAAW